MLTILLLLTDFLFIFSLEDLRRRRVGFMERLTA